MAGGDAQQAGEGGAAEHARAALPRGNSGPAFGFVGYVYGSRESLPTDNMEY
jgi:hypothetical protein